jgi:hypothetical protein
LAGWYDNPFPTQFLASIACLKIPALYVYFGKRGEVREKIEGQQFT